MLNFYEFQVFESRLLTMCKDILERVQHYNNFAMCKSKDSTAVAQLMFQLEDEITREAKPLPCFHKARHLTGT